MIVGTGLWGSLQGFITVLIRALWMFIGAFMIAMYLP